MRAWRGSRPPILRRRGRRVATTLFCGELRRGDVVLVVTAASREEDLVGRVEGVQVVTALDEGGPQREAEERLVGHVDGLERPGGVHRLAHGDRQADGAQLGDEGAQDVEHALGRAPEDLAGGLVDVGLVLEQDVQCLGDDLLTELVAAQDHQRAGPVQGL